MRIEIPKKDWHMELADAIERSADGDEIVCHSEEMKKLGEGAKKRMCPNKQVSFTVESRRTDFGIANLG